MELHFLADVLEEFQMFLVTRVNTGDLFRIQVHLSHLLDTSFKANPHKFRGVLEEYFVFNRRIKYSLHLHQTLILEQDDSDAPKVRWILFLDVAG